jgi:hypothetical protein
MDGEDQRVFAWVVLEYSFRRRVRKDAAVPVELAVDAYGRKGRGSAPEAMMCFTVRSPSRLSK